MLPASGVRDEAPVSPAVSEEAAPQGRASRAISAAAHAAPALHPAGQAGSPAPAHAESLTAPAAASSPAAAASVHAAVAQAGGAQHAPAETFAALDTQPRDGATVWTHTGPQRAEAGFQDPALGWVGVRADSSGGGIHAVIVPDSAQAAQVLGTHMQGLNLHLANQHLPVATLSLQADASGSGAAYQGNQQQGQAQPGAGDSGPIVATQSSRAAAPASSPESAAFVSPARSGTYISVMA